MFWIMKKNKRKKIMKNKLFGMKKKNLLWKLMFEDIKKKNERMKKKRKKLMKLLLDEEKKKIIKQNYKDKKTYKIAFLWF